MRKRLVALALVANVAFPVHASPSDCSRHYLNGDAPEITNTSMTAKAREVCYSRFAVMHSGITRTPLWSAEHLTRADVDSASGLERINRFHSETELPVSERAELKDYSRSGFDRGHLAPSADMPNSESQQESFSLANMVPQDPKNNRGLWEGIESAVRTLARKDGELFVVTGALFKGDSLQQLNDRVMVPTHLYKIVYDPKQGKAAAYLVENTATNDYTIVKVADLEALAGINFFPTMPPAVKRAKLDLPEPTPNGDHRRAKSQPSTYSEVDRVLRALRGLLR